MCGLTPFKICMLNNFPFIENSIYELDNYGIMCKIIEHLRNVSEITNEQSTAINNLERRFDTLDLQDEVNNKLDEMAQSGELTEIISSYLNTKAIISFNTVSDLKEANNLIVGSKVKTLGYRYVNDEGGANYLVREVINTDVVDDCLLIALNDTNLVAELLYSDTINVAQFGAYGDNLNDDTNYIRKAISALKYGMTLKFANNKRYIIKETINLPFGANYDFNYSTISPKEINDSFVFEYGLSSLENDSQSQILKFEIKNMSAINLTDNIVNLLHIKKECWISNIYTWKFNKVINCYPDYIDFIKINTINMYAKTGDDFAIDTGFIGDARTIENIHYYVSNAVSQTHNVLKISAALNNCIVNNFVNGNISIAGSNTTFTNIHNEIGNIVVDNGEVNIDGLYIWKRPQIVPIVLNSGAKLNLRNCLISYRDSFDYSNDLCEDIHFNHVSASANIENAYKCMQSNESVTFKVLAGLKSNNVNFNENMTNASLNGSFRNNILASKYKSFPIVNQYGMLNTTSYTDGNNKWKKESGTYYYGLICIYDDTRKVGLLSDNVTNKAVEQNGSSVLLTINSLSNCNLRVYRGAANNQFSEYVDTTSIDGRLVDNGILCNGNKWISRTTGPKDTLLSAMGYEHINPRNVRVFANNAPTTGTWKKGDIVINYNPSTGSPYGWLCIADGTPGTWKIISNIS